MLYLEPFAEATIERRRAEMEAFLQAAANYDLLRRSDALRRFLTEGIEREAPPTIEDPSWASGEIAV